MATAPAGGWAAENPGITGPSVGGIVSPVGRVVGGAVVGGVAAGDDAGGVAAGVADDGPAKEGDEGTGSIWAWVTVMLPAVSETSARTSSRPLAA
jgi:hypothetical protein